MVQTVVCLLLYFLRRFCFVANNIFALFKVVFILVVAGSGFRTTGREHSGTKDFSTKQPDASVVDTLSALVYILYSYQGWEHTNYVYLPQTINKDGPLPDLEQIAGEIKAPKKTLRNAAFFSVGLVTILYILISAAFVS